MSLSKTISVTKTIDRIVIQWQRDENSCIERLDELVVLDEHKGNTCVDVHATYEKIMKDGGCTPKQAREQTAGQIARVNAWANDFWQYVGCVATVMGAITDSETGELLGTEEIASDSVWGIEPFAGKDYQMDTESDCIAYCYDQLLTDGYEVTESAEVPRVSASDSWCEPTKTDPAKGVEPLPELPSENEHYRYMYGSQMNADGYNSIDKAEGRVLAVCKECEVAMELKDAFPGSYHESYCSLYESLP